MSKLASVQIITDIQSINNADNIAVAYILGWQVVIKKDEFKIGDKVCYIQIDTVVPELPQYEFLRKNRFIIKTIKLRKQTSQGLIINLPEGEWKEGDDLTDIIGVKKYEKPDNNPVKYGKARVPKKGYKKWIYLFKYNLLYKLFPKLKRLNRSPFPKNLVPITDEERIQNIPQKLIQYANKLFVVSYKLDGSSITIIHSKFLGKSYFRICSRRFELHNRENDWHKVFISTDFKSEVLKLVRHFKTNDIILQGEAIGKFNGNHHNLQNEQIRLFNIYVKGKRLNQKDFIKICLINNIPHCPMYKEVILNHNLPEIIALSEVKDILNPSVYAEGLVWRCVEDNFSFKVINNKYLLKNKN